MMKTVFRPALMAALLFTTPFASASVRTVPEALEEHAREKCEGFVFYAQTEKKQKDLLMCIEKAGLHYQFGEINAKKKEIDITVPLNVVRYHFGQLRNGTEMGALIFIHENKKYLVSTLEIMEGQDAGYRAQMVNQTSDKESGVLTFRPDTIVSSITHELRGLIDALPNFEEDILNQ